MNGSQDHNDSNKLLELSRLAGGLAHEIRNPLSTMNLSLQLLEEDLTHCETDRNALRRSRNRAVTLRKEMQRLNHVLEDFLRFARMPPAQLRPHDLNELVREVVSFVSPEARRKNVTILTSLADALPCDLDRDLLKQALLNLILNAEQAMAEGGKIMIRTWQEADTAKLSVADTGPGIADEVRHQLFEPYVSSKSNGNGLGLPTVKRIVQEHGGHIEVHTEKNQGTCFTITLPASAGAKG